ncbi:peptidoglycan-binding protein [Streptomyces sp. NPDC057580]|uniref:peptidoglycan-binding protein n=1 Tax=Streptomyces sp. NPDC057580 TaxID=3346173 RepID=UPI0036B9677C
MLDSAIAPSASEESPPPQRRRRGGGRRTLLAGTAVLVIGGAGVAVYALRDGKAVTQEIDTTLPTVAVTRGDLASTTEADGTLGYAGSYTVLAGGDGRITWLPQAGDVIRRGHQAYGVDGHRVPLLYGTMPFWRELQEGMSDGYDVLELERNLAALGYGDNLAVDKSFTWATAEAVRDLQKDQGMTRTGTLAPGDVVVQPGAIQVKTLEAALGGGAGGAVYEATGTERRVTVSLPVNQQNIAKKNAAVRVTLPGGKTVAGYVSSVSTVATSSAKSGSQTGAGTENATFEVTVTLDKSADAGSLTGAPVTVGFTSNELKNVLTVPVNALLASSEGEYSVNVVDSAGKVRSVPVKLGVFDGDKVQVTGDLTVGMKVQVPRS